MTIVPLYASLIALLFIGLGVRTIRLRRQPRVAVGEDLRFRVAGMAMTFTVIGGASAYLLVRYAARALA